MYLDKRIYTDGACLVTERLGGIGIVIIDMHDNTVKEISEGFVDTTNNRMELLAVITALEQFPDEPLRIEIVSDSTYVVNAINKGWLRNWVKDDFKGRTNADLWRRLIRGINFHKISFKWVKAHNGNAYNEMADKLAFNARGAIKQ